MRFWRKEGTSALSLGQMCHVERGEECNCDAICPPFQLALQRNKEREGGREGGGKESLLVGSVVVSDGRTRLDRNDGNLKEASADLGLLFFKQRRTQQVSLVPLGSYLVQ